MDWAIVFSIFGMLEATITLLMWLGIDKKTIGRWITMPDITRSKFMLMFLIGAFAFSSIALYSTLRSPVITVTAESILTNPLVEPTSRTAQVNGHRLLRFNDKYNVAMICGVRDSTIDGDDDRRVSFSRLFNIRPESIRITASYSQLMTDEITKRLESLRDRTSKNISTTYWFEAFIVPKGTDMSGIQRLSDIPRHGGQLVTVEWIHLGR